MSNVLQKAMERMVIIIYSDSANCIFYYSSCTYKLMNALQ